MASLGHESESKHLERIIDSIPSLIHTARPDGYLDYFNQRWLQYVGLPIENLLGWKWTASIHPEDVEAIVDRWRFSLASGEEFLHEARVRRADAKIAGCCTIKEPCATSSDEVLSVDELWLSKEIPQPASLLEAPPRLHGDAETRSEREIIEAALAETRGRVSGPSGAVTKLRIPPSTLANRIKALKINKNQYKFG